MLRGMASSRAWGIIGREPMRDLETTLGATGNSSRRRSGRRSSAPKGRSPPPAKPPSTSSSPSTGGRSTSTSGPPDADDRGRQRTSRRNSSATSSRAASSSKYDRDEGPLPDVPQGGALELPLDHAARRLPPQARRRPPHRLARRPGARDLGLPRRAAEVHARPDLRPAVDPGDPLREPSGMRRQLAAENRAVSSPGLRGLPRHRASDGSHAHLRLDRPRAAASQSSR